MHPHEFWQGFAPPNTHAAGPDARFTVAYPATLPDGRQLLLPIRDLPDGSGRAVASLILNQAAFAVQDVLAGIIAARWADTRPDIVVGVPTLGLSLAAAVARRLGHSRMVALGTSRKFWYSDALSEPMRSITSPGQGKAIYLDPRMVPLLTGRRVLLIDDVISTGSSMGAALRVLARAEVAPEGIAVAMVQGDRWRETVPRPERVTGAIRSPILEKTPEGYRVARTA